MEQKKTRKLKKLLQHRGDQDETKAAVVLQSNFRGHKERKLTRGPLRVSLDLNNTIFPDLFPAPLGMLRRLSSLLIALAQETLPDFLQHVICLVWHCDGDSAKQTNHMLEEVRQGLLRQSNEQRGEPAQHAKRCRK
ncbi:unnamed protein product [Pleuronectes platessa]|uniref:Uncharacterized protein n=1 Tax=Pleuronectes platessa TaxID=8262 RepID=A0A9N7UC55_PLEPL|nr:unnamed protein product [Pleuronectes platessa]